MNMSMAKFDTVVQRNSISQSQAGKTLLKLKGFFQLANKFSWLDFLYNIDTVLQ